MSKDEDLKLLHDDPRFEELIASAKKRVAAPMK
jgi:hypothetical protein